MPETADQGGGDKYQRAANGILADITQYSFECLRKGTQPNRLEQRDRIAAILLCRECSDGETALAARAEAFEEAAAACEVKVRRPAGYHGQWEGYGAWDGDMTGPECAAAIRAEEGARC